MAIIGLQTSKSHNNMRIIFLILLMPLVVFLCMLLFFSIFNINGSYKEYLDGELLNINTKVIQLDKQIEKQNLSKNFDFISQEKINLLPIIVENKIVVFEYQDEINYYSRKVRGSDTTISERRKYNGYIDTYSKNKDIANKKITDSIASYYDIEGGDKLLLDYYFNSELSKNFQSNLNEVASPFEVSYMTLLYSMPLIILWLIIGVSLQKRIIFKFTGANELNRKDNKEIYNIVENLCISRGLPLPKIGIIEDDSMNAFATGWTPKNSHIIFSRGLINKLDKDEIEAVAGHELTHIINGDVRTMVIVNVFIGMIGTIGYILMRSGGSRGGSKKGGNPLPILGLFLYIMSLVILPLINMAMSRKKEFLADAGSVELTKNKDSMISALKKISGNSIIEKVSKRNGTVASMFIYDPKVHKKGFFSKVKKLFSTHPSLEERIELLEKY